MRHVRILAAAVALCFGLASATALGQSFKTRAVKVYVKGLVCAFCAQGLSKAFEARKGVLKVHVELDEGVVLLQLQEETPLPADEVKGIVRDAGFDVVRIEDAAPTA